MTIIGWLMDRLRGNNDWEPMVDTRLRRGDFINAPATHCPLRMRKRGADGRWIYREPTEEEVLDFIKSEAW